MNHVRAVAAAAGAVVAVTALGACTPSDDGGGGSGSGPVTLEYWMWDDVQLPAYEQCAADFTEANPDIEVNITQTAWGEYWTNLTTQLAAGSAPDVWVDQASYYPQFVADQQIVDLQPYLDESDLDLAEYVDGLADIWVIDEARYGLPKDWDTIALVYDKAKVEAAGIDPATLSELTWNPDDGGTFGETIAALSVDSAGRNGLDPAFDPGSVVTYGFLPEWADGSQGQNGWGNFAASLGWTYSDTNPFGTEFNYDDPALVETVDWLAGLSDQGFAPPLDAQSTLARSEVLLSGGGAMTTLGSFNMSTYADVSDQYGIAPLPIGPEGRKSAMNGLSDAIYAGSENKDAAWQWVEYLASPECQQTVAESGVVFPAVQSATETAVEVRSADGLDAQVFVDQQQTEDGTFLIPISEHGSEISQIVQDAIQSVALGQADAATALPEANEKVNALFD